ncbi:MAG: nickel-responsive transcriptional regulator NikR [Candidatus Omnitrophica bacterium]|nr:nickel-responsive transcriptional regulator NikR [Candidatus Omnitrophota bacterium]
MSGIIRFGISLDEDLSKKYDVRIKKKGYSNRSEAIRDLIRQDLVDQEWDDGSVVAGAITLIYDHHKRELLNKITDIQHDFHEGIISAQHIHLDHHNCLEIIAFKGNPFEIKKLADRLKAVKGVKHSTLSMSTTGKKLD